MCEFKARGEAAFLASTMALPWLLGSSLAIWGQPSEQVRYSPEPKAPPKTFQKFKSNVTVFRSPFCHWFISYRGKMLACVYPARWRRPTSELRCSRAAVRCPGTADKLACAKNLFPAGTESNTAWDWGPSALWHCPALSSTTTISPHSYLGHILLFQHCKAPCWWAAARPWNCFGLN